ncbi:MAG: hypothetical protein IPK13_20360 [Deltaproteobacteria bacterium]|nr:hypothetical protein [Deltaproteobacteria bacterium]
MQEDRRCGTCANWMPRADIKGWPNTAAGVGGCHRHAPRPVLTDDMVNVGAFVQWPITAEHDQCGDWFYGGERCVAAVAADSAAEKTPSTVPPRKPTR